MATRGKRTRKPAPARKIRRAAPKKTSARRKPAAQTRRAQAKPKRAASAARTRIPTSSTNLSTLRVVWRPAIAMATLPYRVYRVYRWAEAESHRSGGAGSHASA